MTHYADLSPCDYFTSNHEGKLIAVGWLSRGHAYSKGDISAEVFARLHQLLANPWQPCVAMGAHACDFHRFTDGPCQITLDNVTAQLGVSNLFVPSGDRLLVAPSLILHYIDAYEYSPPPEFCDAVMACPEMRSMDYLKLVRKTAPAALFSGNQTQM
ncbi:DUF7919 family protein [Rhodopirellula baltica]|uniref:DUF7919 domain-containing protein n=1 Tax=Rhodopirellula baltica SWK14 TaxID=993516 RepID=L7CD21_RHOBT|nr:hypothetical protein [Rhodopirellula baltica]ELP31522.1 hypothetical protein RBSWK_04540 [Rhodopirellula baltica SWK14]